MIQILQGMNDLKELQGCIPAFLDHKAVLASLECLPCKALKTVNNPIYTPTYPININKKYIATHASFLKKYQ
jgi:hypothetical protein